MITVKDLIEKLHFLLNENYLNENDIVVLCGTGDHQSGFINSICMPKVIPKFDVSEKGYYHIGFCGENNIDNKYIGLNILNSIKD